MINFLSIVYIMLATGSADVPGGTSGLMILSLLGLAGICVGRSVRRIDVGTSCAAAALVAAAVAACFDFDWHLPALALAAGWAAGLAGSGSDAVKHK